MGKLNITIETASNGVYFTYKGETVVFTDPLLLGDHLMDLAIDANDTKDEDEVETGGTLTYDLYVSPVDMNNAIPQIKMIREITAQVQYQGLSLKEAKDVCDTARNTGDKVLLIKNMDEAHKDRAMATIRSWVFTPVVKSFTIVRSDKE